MNTSDVIFVILLVMLMATFVISFVYMLKKRGIISSFFWAFVPFRLLLSWTSDTEYDDNPPWLDRVQIALIAALVVLVYVRKS